jgi:ankyrin repeat protein
LLGAGAAVNQADDDGATPLYLAAKEGRVEVVLILPLEGAAVDQAEATSLVVAAC